MPSRRSMPNSILRLRSASGSPLILRRLSSASSAYSDGYKPLAVFSRQVQAVDGDRDLALAEPAPGLYRNTQGGALTLLELNRLRATVDQLQLTLRGQLHIEFLGLGRQVGEVQGQGGLVASCQEARRRQLGNQRGGDHGLDFGHTVAIIAPGLGHQAQFAVEVGNIDADFTLAFVVQSHRGALQDR